jgi:hypothetical protein
MQHPPPPQVMDRQAAQGPTPQKATQQTQKDDTCKRCCRRIELWVCCLCIVCLAGVTEASVDLDLDLSRERSKSRPELAGTENDQGTGKPQIPVVGGGYIGQLNGAWHAWEKSDAAQSL